MEDQLAPPNLQMTVARQALPLFTTVLQSGIEIKTTRGQSLTDFLTCFPGFTTDYLGKAVQTVFLNGTAIDDLSQPLTGHHPVLALSAAMPGLAGAIFRKNGLHSSLRSETKSLKSSEQGRDRIEVTLKLFNSIARDRGPELLEKGVILHADRLQKFLSKRPDLLRQITHIRLAENDIQSAEFLQVLSELSTVNIKISV